LAGDGVLVYFGGVVVEAEAAQVAEDHLDRGVVGDADAQIA